MKSRNWLTPFVFGVALAFLLGLFGGDVVAQVGTLFVENGKVGIGTEAPTSLLDVQDDSTEVAVRDMLRVSNLGGVNFELENRNTGNRWKMGHKFDNDAYVITLLGSGTTEFQLTPAGHLVLTGDLSVFGTKNFVAEDPDDPGKKIYFSALEGPEAGTYYRGTAKLEEGLAEIGLPAVFSKMTETNGLTVQLTPVGGWSHLYVEELGPERLVVRAERAQDAEFHYLVQGIRKGYKDFQVVR